MIAGRQLAVVRDFDIALAKPLRQGFLKGQCIGGCIIGPGQNLVKRLARHARQTGPCGWAITQCVSQRRRIFQQVARSQQIWLGDQAQPLALVVGHTDLKQLNGCRCLIAQGEREAGRIASIAEIQCGVWRE